MVEASVLYEPMDEERDSFEECEKMLEEMLDPALASEDREDGRAKGSA